MASASPQGSKPFEKENWDGKTDRVSRLGKETEFLFRVALCPVHAYNLSIRNATEEQLKAIIECLRNIRLFVKSAPIASIKDINCSVSACLPDAGNARQALINKQSLVQAVLAEIFTKIMLAEFHFLFCQ